MDFNKHTRTRTRNACARTREKGNLMRIVVEIHENHIGEMLSIEEKINIESYKATDVETEILKRTTKVVKDICRDIEEKYY